MGDSAPQGHSRTPSDSSSVTFNTRLPELLSLSPSHQQGGAKHALGSSMPQGTRSLSRRALASFSHSPCLPPSPFSLPYPMCTACRLLFQLGEPSGWLAVLGHSETAGGLESDPHGSVLLTSSRGKYGSSPHCFTSKQSCEAFLANQFSTSLHK